MSLSVDELSDESALTERAAQYFAYSYNELASHVDRMFIWLLSAEWLGMMAAAWIIAPRTWTGLHASVNLTCGQRYWPVRRSFCLRSG